MCSDSKILVEFHTNVKVGDRFRWKGSATSVTHQTDFLPGDVCVIKSTQRGSLQGWNERVNDWSWPIPERLRVKSWELLKKDEKTEERSPLIVGERWRWKGSDGVFRPGDVGVVVKTANGPRVRHERRGEIAPGVTTFGDANWARMLDVEESWGPGPTMAHKAAIEAEPRISYFRETRDGRSYPFLTVAIVRRGDRYGVGTSQCGKSDQPSYGFGRRVASARAELAASGVTLAGATSAGTKNFNPREYLRALRTEHRNGVPLTGTKALALVPSAIISVEVAMKPIAWNPPRGASQVRVLPPDAATRADASEPGVGHPTGRHLSGSAPFMAQQPLAPQFPLPPPSDAGSCCEDIRNLDPPFGFSRYWCPIHGLR